MTSQAEHAAQHDGDLPVPYMARTRDYYQALGHAPYRWAQYDAVPFQPLPRPLAACRVALVTTAAPFDPAKGDQGPGAAYNAAAKFYQVYSLDSATDPDLRISHIAYDRQHSPATDPQAWLPLRALRRAVAAGRIGALAPRLHGAPTNRSQRHTTEVDAPELLRRLQEDGSGGLGLLLALRVLCCCCISSGIWSLFLLLLLVDLISGSTLQHVSDQCYSHQYHFRWSKLS